MSTDPSKQVKLGSLSGLVPKEKAMAFERILFRATRGNIFLRQEPVDEPVTDPVSGEKVGTYFLAFFLILLEFFRSWPFQNIYIDNGSYLYAQLEKNLNDINITILCIKRNGRQTQYKYLDNSDCSNTDNYDFMTILVFK